MKLPVLAKYQQAESPAMQTGESISSREGDRLPELLEIH